MERVHAWVAISLGVVAAALASCSDRTPEGGTDASSPGSWKRGLEWRQGTEDSLVYSHDETEVVRCWKQQSRFDCLYVDQSAVRDAGADTPFRRIYSRFIAEKLPANHSALERAGLADGYRCEISESKLGRFFRETISKDGVEIVENTVAEGSPDSAPWRRAAVESTLAANGLAGASPYFYCQALDELIRDAGLPAVDSPLIAYGDIMRPNALRDPPPPEPGGAE